jgi:hypothetical protein
MMRSRTRRAIIVAPVLELPELLVENGRSASGHAKLQGVTALLAPMAISMQSELNLGYCRAHKPEIRIDPADNENSIMSVFLHVCLFEGVFAADGCDEDAASPPGTANLFQTAEATRDNFALPGHRIDAVA